MTRATGAALGGLALILAALAFDASPLFVPGVAFSVLGVGTAAWIAMAARGATIERRLDRDRVIEDEPVEATIEARRGAWGLPRAEIAEPMADHTISLDGQLSVIRGSSSMTIRVVARFGRRGRHVLPPPTLIVHDPLGLVRAELAGRGPDELLVLPRTEPVRWNHPEGGGALPGRATLRQSSESQAAADLDGLRPYRPGTPASRIYWPALARSGKLLERRLHADADERPLVVLDARCPGPSEHLDAAVRAAASLTLALARRGGCGILLPGERHPVELGPDLAAWPAVHVRLALVEAAAQTHALTLGRENQRRQLLYVAAQPLRRPPTATRGASHGSGALVLPKDLAVAVAGSPSFEVAGCVGFAVRTRRRAGVKQAV